MIFHFSHLSDVHLTPMPTPSRRELISKRITGYMNWQRKRQFEISRPLMDAVVADAKKCQPDHFVVSGDLVNLALDAEIKTARDWLENLAAPDQVSLVCGNHDAYIKGTLQKAAKEWGQWLDGDKAEFSGNPLPNNWETFDDKYPIVQRRQGIAFVGVSTSIPTRPFSAAGVISSKQLQRLERTLKELGDEGLCRVVVLHHPPHKNASHRHKRLIASKRFRNVIKKAGAELILHGHTHLDTMVTIEGPTTDIPVICVPATGQLPGHKRPAGRHNLYTITSGKTEWTIELSGRGIAQEASANPPFQIVELVSKTFKMPRSI